MRKHVPHLEQQVLIVSWIRKIEARKYFKLDIVVGRLCATSFYVACHACHPPPPPLLHLFQTNVEQLYFQRHIHLQPLVYT